MSGFGDLFGEQRTEGPLDELAAFFRPVEKISNEMLRDRMALAIQTAVVESEREIETELHLLEILQDMFWNDLSNQLRYARTGWSIGVENALRRLVLTLGYAEPSRRVPFAMIHSGMYEQVLDLAGYSRPHTDQEWAELQDEARRYMEDNQP